MCESRFTTAVLNQREIDRDREHFWTVCLDIQDKIIAIDLTSLGCKKSVIAEPMEVYSFAIKHRAVKIVAVHNHPGGYLKPSERDKILTEQLCQTGKIINIPLVEHLIISDKRYYSFDESGLLVKLKFKKEEEIVLLNSLYQEIKKMNAVMKKIALGKDDEIEL